MKDVLFPSQTSTFPVIMYLVKYNILKQQFCDKLCRNQSVN